MQYAPEPHKSPHLLCIPKVVHKYQLGKTVANIQNLVKKRGEKGRRKTEKQLVIFCVFVFLHFVFAHFSVFSFRFVSALWILCGGACCMNNRFEGEGIGISARLSRGGWGGLLGWVGGAGQTRIAF